MAGRAERPEPVLAQKVLALVVQGQQAASRQPEALRAVLERQVRWMVQRAWAQPEVLRRLARE